MRPNELPKKHVDERNRNESENENSKASGRESGKSVQGDGEEVPDLEISETPAHRHPDDGALTDTVTPREGERWIRMSPQDHGGGVASPDQ